MEQSLISPTMLVADVLASSKGMAPLFVELRLDCPGCSMKRFCTLEDLCRQYELDLETLIHTIQKRINDDESY